MRCVAGSARLIGRQSGFAIRCALPMSGVQHKVESSTIGLRPGLAGGAPSIIWISGYSASGKTTVARRVEALLRERGVPAVLLDGDDLRSILAGRWGYSRDERIELARVYFRLCSHLAAQGLTVIISAVAMYDDVREWLRENVSGAIEIFLDVPEEERRARDSATKKLYDKLGSQMDMYDEPAEPHLVVANHGEVTSEAAAMQIADYALSESIRQVADHGRTEHWRSFYTNADAPVEPSGFARLVAEELSPGVRLLEVGCGNGRDASYFASEGMRVLALDPQAEAIEAARRRYSSHQLTFLTGTVSEIPDSSNSFDAVYSRFCLHAMVPEEEDEFLARSVDLLKPNGSLFIECRSVNDPLARKGEVISKTERICGHYRRFIVREELSDKVTSLGYHIVSVQESSGLAKLGDDDPVVIRLHALAHS